MDKKISNIIDIIVYLPAFFAWIIFAPLFRLAHYLRPMGSKGGTWYWLGIEAIDHETRYSIYDED